MKKVPARPDAAVSESEAAVPKPGDFVRHRQDATHRDAYPPGVLVSVDGDGGTVQPHVTRLPKWTAPMVDIDADTDRIDLGAALKECLSVRPTPVIPAGALEGRRTGMRPMDSLGVGFSRGACQDETDPGWRPFALVGVK